MREAITRANDALTPDRIAFAGAGIGTIILRAALPPIIGDADPMSVDLIIDASDYAPGGTPLVSIERSSELGTPAFRILTVASSAPLFKVNLFDLKITNGFVDNDVKGGGIKSEGDLTVTRCVVTGNMVSGENTASYGGGIYTALGKLTVAFSEISNNTVTSRATEPTNIEAEGGGVACFCGNNGSLTIDSSTISGNRAFVTNALGQGVGATASGGGIASYGDLDGVNSGKVDILNSTISDNIALSEVTTGPTTAAGGGIFTKWGPVNIFWSTIAGNSAHLDALEGPQRRARSGGVQIDPNFPTRVSLFNIIAANNTIQIQTNGPTGEDLICNTTTLNSFGHNLIETPANPLFCPTGNKDRYNVDPKLEMLLPNGGFTKTHRVMPGSVAINSGKNAAPLGYSTPGYDQRGEPFKRIVNGFIDRGAYECHSPNCRGGAGSFSIPTIRSPT